MNFKFLAKFFAVVCVLCTLLGTTAYAASTRFKDLNGYSWAEEYIDALAEKGIISGTSQDTFAPGNNVKREEFVKVIVNLFGYDTTNATCNFTDVKTTDWHYKYVAAATKAGIINGVGDNKFGTGSNITRQDICVILYRVLNDKGYTVNETKTGSMNFTDLNEISDYAKDAVEKLYKAEIINGMDDKHFAPKNFATRAQMAKLAYLCDEKKIKKSEGGSQGEETPEPAEDIKINKLFFDSYSLKLYVGESKKNVPLFEPSNATNAEFVWSSSNEDVAIVSGDGTVTALSLGTSNIKVTTKDGTKNNSFILEVAKAPIPVADLYMNTPKIEVAVGESTKLTVTVLPVNATNKKIIWTSSDESIAKVKDGKVEGVSLGSAIITAQAEDGGRTISCRVTVTNATVHVDRLSMNVTSLSLTVGQSYTLIPVYTPVNATNKTATWKTEKSNVATVTNAGLVKAVSPGISRITATSTDGNHTATCTVTVVGK